MQILNVPLKKDPFFENELKRFLLHQISSMYSLYKEIPDEVSLRGRLGRRLYNIITSNDWNFGKTKIIHEKGSDVIVIRFTRNITVKKESGVSQSETLDGKIVNGWMDSNAMNSLAKSSSQSGFSIEKTVTPSITILIRELKTP